MMEAKSKIRVGVAGAGSMGCGIAQVAARYGHDVVLYDAYPDSLERARHHVESDLKKLNDKGKISDSHFQDTVKKLHYTGSIEHFKTCELVIEAVIEDLEVKKKLFAGIESVVADHTVLATNTSSLPVVAIAAACKHRQRFVGIHFFNPATIMPLVEIVPAFTTSGDTVNKAAEIVSSWDKVTVIAKDTPGFIVNRIARPFYGEAIRMYEEGIADFAAIDASMREMGGFRMGPFELMDFIGNDINYKVTETVWEQFFYDPRYRPSITQKRLFEAGLFGRKSGRGYYDYSSESEKPETTLNGVQGKYIFERILSMLINEAADALYLKIASRDDIDTAMTKGVNYPKGLLKWADEIGIGKILDNLNRLQTDYGDDRYRPSLLLKKMFAEKRSFY